MHSRQTLHQYTTRPAHRQAPPHAAPLRARPRPANGRFASGILRVCAALLLTAIACHETPTGDHSAPARTLDLDALQREVLSYEPTATSSALAQLIWALDDPELDGQQVVRLRDLLSQVAVDVWLGLRAAAVMCDATDGQERLQWLDRRDAWAAALAILAARTEPGSEPNDDERWFAAVVRPMLRPLLRTPETADRARVRMAILHAIQFAQADSNRAHSLASLRLTSGTPGALQANTFLALNALPLLLAGERSVDAVSLALATPQTCPAGLDVLARSPGASAALEALRRRCGFACTDTQQLGDDGVPLPPLTATIHASCRADTIGLPTSTRGDYLGVDNFLAVHALEELARSAAVISQDAPDDPLRVLVQPALDRFALRLQTFVAVGHLPFFAAEGAGGFTLPEQDGIARPLQPTPAVLVVRQHGLAVAAWPRFVIENGTVVAPGDERFGFPGATVARLDAPRPDPPQAEALSAALAAVKRLPWPVPAATETVTLVVDRDTPLTDFLAALDCARRAGVDTVQLATWPRQLDELDRPVVTGLAVRIDPVPPRTARLRAADGDTVLLDTLGRAKPIPLFAVRDFLPDIYAAVVAYATANPALAGLAVETSPELPLPVVLGLLQALQWQRDGDVMESTEQLLAAPPTQNAQGFQTLMTPLYLVLPTTDR